MSLVNTILKGNDAEFLLKKLPRDKRLSLRIGRLWRVPAMRGTSVLMCDYDNVPRVNLKAIRQVLAESGVHTVRIQKRHSPSGKGWHVAIHVRGVLCPFQMVALQLLCQSDRKREAHNFRRALSLTQTKVILYHTHKKFAVEFGAETFPFQVLFEKQNLPARRRGKRK